MEPETVVDMVQVSAATEAAREVAAEVAADSMGVVGAVAAVDERLAEHAEVSEERHEEILEGQAWQENQFQSISSVLTALQTTLTSQLSALQALIMAQQTMLESVSQNLSMVLNRSNPVMPEPVAEPVTVEVPASGEEENPAPVTKRRRVAVI